MVAFFIGVNMYKVGDVLDSNKCGKFKIVKITSGSHKYRVKFLDTGYEKDVSHSSLNSGCIKDPFVPTVCGVGYIGDSKFKVYDGTKNTVHYTRWANMLNRCYGKKSGEGILRTYGDATVCREWLSFGVFAQWFEDNLPDTDDISKYDLDKDKVGEGSKVYSPETCRVISHSENMKLIKASKEYPTIISPEGVEHNLTNAAKFSRENGMSVKSLQHLLKGRWNQYKGWTVKKDK